jgi:uncharacterized OsmC-like protein
LKIDKSHKDGVNAYIENRRKTTDKAKMAGTIRIDLRHVEHLNFQGIVKEGGNFVLEIDEPPQRDGYGKGPTPLNYFLIGAGSCLLMQWAKLALIEDLDIDNLEAIVLGHTDRRVDGYFTDFVFDINMTGNESPEKIKHVAKESERLCFVHNTLKRAVPVTTNVMLNSQVVYTSKLGPRKEEEEKAISA